MRLGDWLTHNRLSHADFAALIEGDRSSVTKYISGERMPRREVINRIIAATGGEVTANDFLGGPVLATAAADSPPAPPD